MTLKNAYHLQAYWKQLKKDGNCVATLLPVGDANKALRKEYKGQLRQTYATIPDSAPAKVTAWQRRMALEATSVKEEGDASHFVTKRPPSSTALTPADSTATN